MKQKHGYNWHGKSTWASREHEREMSMLKSQPTARQRKYVSFLCKTLADHGIKIPASRYGLISRMDYADYIGELVALCEKNNIPIKDNGKQFERVATVKGDGPIEERLQEVKKPNG